MRKPVTKPRDENPHVLTSFKRTLSPSDVDEQAHFVHVCIEEPLCLAFDSCMTMKSMLRIYDYDQPSDADVPTCLVALAHTNVCIIANNSDDDDMNTHEPVHSRVNVHTNVPSDMYQSYVEALLDDASNSSSEMTAECTPANVTSRTVANTVVNTPEYTTSSTVTDTSRLVSSRTTSRMPSPPPYNLPSRHPHVVYVDDVQISVGTPSFKFVPRVDRYAHVVNRRTGNRREINANRMHDYSID